MAGDQACLGSLRHHHLCSFAPSLAPLPQSLSRGTGLHGGLSREHRCYIISLIPLPVGDGEGSLACCSPWGHQEFEHDGATELMINLDSPVRDREWNGGV